MANYFTGVAVGLLIAWVTSLIAYLRAKQPPSWVKQLVILEFVICCGAFIVGLL